MNSKPVLFCFCISINSYRPVCWRGWRWRWCGPPQGRPSIRRSCPWCRPCCTGRHSIGHHRDPAPRTVCRPQPGWRRGSRKYRSGWRSYRKLHYLCDIRNGSYKANDLFIAIVNVHSSPKPSSRVKAQFEIEKFPSEFVVVKSNTENSLTKGTLFFSSDEVL